MWNRTTPLCISAVLTICPVMARAQDAATQPVREVRTAIGTARAIATQSARQAAATARDWTLRLRTTNGQCYEVVGLAVGESRVTAEVHARNTRVGDAVLISTSNEHVARGRFCASLPGNVYTVRVHADGRTNWSLSVIPSSADAAPNAGSAGAADSSAAGGGVGVPPALAGIAGGGSGVGSGGARGMGPPNAADRPADGLVAPAPQFPVGGTENDYVAQQIRTWAQSRAGARPLMAVNRAALQTSETREMSQNLNGGACVEVVAVAVPSASDVDIEIFDPAGNRIAQDTQHRATESVRFCPSYTGRYRFAVRMFAGFGLTGVQAFQVR